MASQPSKSAPKKPKLVRDSFTIPKTEYAAIDTLKTRAIGLGTSVKKSELIRAGLMALQALNDAAYKAALAAVPTLKTGRPVADKPEAKTPARTPVKAAVKPAVKQAIKPAARPSAKPAAKPAAKAAAKPVAPKKTAEKKPAPKTA